MRKVRIKCDRWKVEISIETALIESCCYKLPIVHSPRDDLCFCFYPMPLSNANTMGEAKPCGRSRKSQRLHRQSCDLIFITQRNMIIVFLAALRREAWRENQVWKNRETVGVMTDGNMNPSTTKFGLFFGHFKTPTTNNRDEEKSISRR